MAVAPRRLSPHLLPLIRIEVAVEEQRPVRSAELHFGSSISAWINNNQEMYRNFCRAGTCWNPSNSAWSWLPEAWKVLPQKFSQKLLSITVLPQHQTLSLRVTFIFGNWKVQRQLSSLFHFGSLFTYENGIVHFPDGVDRIPVSCHFTNRAAHFFTIQAQDLDILPWLTMWYWNILKLKSKWVTWRSAPFPANSPKCCAGAPTALSWAFPIDVLAVHIF